MVNNALMRYLQIKPCWHIGALIVLRNVRFLKLNLHLYLS